VHTEDIQPSLQWKHDFEFNFQLYLQLDLNYEYVTSLASSRDDTCALNVLFAAHAARAGI
jgi:hypothetical protein